MVDVTRQDVGEGIIMKTSEELIDYSISERSLGASKALGAIGWISTAVQTMSNMDKTIDIQEYDNIIWKLADRSGLVLQDADLYKLVAKMNRAYQFVADYAWYFFIPPPGAKTQSESFWKDDLFIEKGGNFLESEENRINGRISSYNEQFKCAINSIKNNKNFTKKQKEELLKPYKELESNFKDYMNDWEERLAYIDGKFREYVTGVLPDINTGCGLVFRVY